MTDQLAASEIESIEGGEFYKISKRLLMELADHRRDLLVEAAKRWGEERYARDDGDRLLLAALANAYPGECNTRENCTCKEPCDECPPQSVIDAEIDWMKEKMGVLRAS